MLIQFRFKNFKSFKEDTILDLSATKITEHSNRIFSAGGEKILPVAAIYGANASGKSNVIEAFDYMQHYVLHSFNYGGSNDREKSKKIRHIPFAFDEQSRRGESLFEVYFIDEQDNYKTYNYGFILNEEEVIEEWLNYKAKTANEYKKIFYRSATELDLSGIPNKWHDNIKISLNKEVLVVSLGSKLKVLPLGKIWDWFYNNNCVNFGDPRQNMFLSRLIPPRFEEDKDIQKKVIKYFSSFDPSIIDFSVETYKDNGEEKIHIDTIHKMINGGEGRIPLEEESSGTLKMFTLYSFLQDTLESGGILFVDELNDRLHPLLVRNVILTFLNPEVNVHHAQLVFSTHDSWQLSNDLLRRDEIWFTEKGKDGVSTLYSLADFVDEDGSKIRKDECYEKNYLLGKYGAIPNLKSLDMFKED